MQFNLVSSNKNNKKVSVKISIRKQVFLIIYLLNDTYANIYSKWFCIDEIA